MALYEITYAIIPAGVGPDDYEPADLEQRTERFELADPEPGTGYGPHMADVHAALKAALPEGSTVHVSRMTLVTG